MAAKPKRRTYPVIDQKLQYKFLGLVILYCLLIVIFLALALFVPDLVTLADADQSLELRAAAAEKILALHARVWPAILALMVLFGLHSFRQFHRLIGPLFRFRQSFGIVQGGDLTHRVRLRENDYLHKEEESFNQMVESLAGDMEKLKTATREIDQALGKLPSNGNEEVHAGIANALDKMEKNLKRFKT